MNNGLLITKVQVFPIPNPTNKIKGLARIELNDSLQLTGLRIVEGANGDFVAYPHTYDNNQDYMDVFYPITKELRVAIETAVLEKYNNESK